MLTLKASLRIYPTCPWLQSERILKSEFGPIYREFLVPCHRVLGAGKRLTGYAAGVEKKAWLLEHEGADFKDIE